MHKITEVHWQIKEFLNIIIFFGGKRFGSNEELIIVEDGCFANLLESQIREGRHLLDTRKEDALK